MKILVLGIGNILLQDEGVGVHIVNRLQKENRFPENVHLVDGGTAGLGLMPTLEGGYDRVIVVDAINAKDEPGSVYRFTFDDIPFDFPKKISPHEIGIFETLTLALLGGLKFGVTVIGIVPRTINQWGMELTPEVESKMEAAMNVVLKELKELGVMVETKVFQ